MKYKTSMLSILLLITWGIFSQKAPNKATFEVYGINIDTLAQMVHKHPRYFEHLKKLWIEKSHSMPQDELMLLYYGSAFMKNYHPKKEDEAVEQIAKIMAEMEFAKAINEGKKLLDVYPLNARLYMLMGYAYKKIGEKQKSKHYYQLYADILRIPLYSGSGKNFDSAFVVRNISDEYLILNQKDLELVMQEMRYHNELPFDVMRIKPKSKDNKRMQELPKEKLYFNVYLPYFIGQGKNYKSLQEDARRKYKLPKE